MSRPSLRQCSRPALSLAPLLFFAVLIGCGADSEPVMYDPDKAPPVPKPGEVTAASAGTGDAAANAVIPPE